MSDLFHPQVPDEYIESVCRVMQLTPWHRFQLLTKRPERMRTLLSGPLRWAADLDHCWWGVSVEDRKYGLPRMDLLRETPAQVRFLSIEPLLEDLGPLDLTGIHWVIVGGESGPGARPLEPQWVRSVRDQCVEQGVPFFFKQWGQFHPQTGRNVGKKAAGRRLDGRTWDEKPERRARAIDQSDRAKARAMALEIARPWTARMAA